MNFNITTLKEEANQIFFSKCTGQISGQFKLNELNKIVLQSEVIKEAT